MQYVYVKMFLRLCLCIHFCVFVHSLQNFIFILTDDQDVLLNSMAPMNRTIDLIGKRGATFLNAYANSPICCPSRSTILTGKYLHNVQVTNNSISGNCSSPSWQKYHEPFSIANILKTQKSYNTFYAGKYLNQYGSKPAGGAEHVPPGYDWWIGLEGNSKYYNYTLSVNGTAKYFKDCYLTDLIKDYAMDFLNQARPKGSPFFMMLTPPAAHAPFTPAPRHRNKFAGVRAPRTVNFNFTSTDKHWIITMPPKHLPTDVSRLDSIYQSRLETLLAVDEMVNDIYLKLKEIGLLNETYIIFTSDHGFHIGQFAQPWDKRQPYETDIKVPLLIRGPGIVNKILKAPVSLIDVAPTILELANIDVPNDVDGNSLVPMLKNKIPHDFKTNGGKYLFIEYHGEGDEKTIDDGCPCSVNLSECSLSNWCKCQDSRNNTYTCVKFLMDDIDFKYCRFYDDLNFREAFDLTKDPYELINIYEKLNEDVIKHFEDVIDEYFMGKFQK